MRRRNSELSLKIREGLTSSRFTLSRQIGQGCMSSVLLAESEESGEQFVAKFPNNERQQTALSHEGFVLDQLTHPNIVAKRYYGPGEIATRGKLLSRTVLMTHYSGVPLESYLIGGPLDIDESLQMGDEVTAALDFAHGKGIVHRDIKPDNIFMGNDGQARLGDFGISADLRNGLIGCNTAPPRYSAPEVKRGPIPQSDIYGYAITLYETLSGTLPKSSRSKLLNAMCRPDDTAPQIPTQVQEVLAKGYAKDHRERPNNIAVFQQLLHAAVS